MSPFAISRKAILGGCAAGILGAAVGVQLADSNALRQDAVGLPRTATKPGATVTAPEGDDPAVVALRYVLNGQALLDAGPGGVDALLAPLVAPSARRDLVEENRRSVARVHADLAAATGPVRWRQAPLAIRAEARGEFATVAVWHVGVLSAPGAVPPQSHWSTSTVELEQVQGEWKVTAETIANGPVPLNAGGSAPSESDDFDAALTGFAAPDAP